MRFRRTWVFGFVLVGIASGALALGRGVITAGEFDVFYRDIEWKPRCPRPALLGGRRIDRWEIDAYLACVNKQAEQDLQAAADAINAGRKRDIDALVAELRSAQIR